MTKYFCDLCGQEVREPKNMTVCLMSDEGVELDEETLEFCKDCYGVMMRRAAKMEVMVRALKKLGGGGAE